MIRYQRVLVAMEDVTALLYAVAALSWARLTGRTRR